MTTKIVNLTKDSFDVYVGRPSKYGNPFMIGRDGSRGECVELFRQWVYTQPELLADIRLNLTGKTLGCYCKPSVCHADILAEICDQHTDDFDY